MDQLPRYSVMEFWSSNRNEDSELTVRWHGKCFQILLSPSYFQDSPSITDQYLYHLKAADAEELDDLTIEDLYDWALEPFISIFNDLAPPPKPEVLQQKFTLHDYFESEILSYRLGAINKKLIPIPNDYSRSSSRWQGIEIAGIDLPSACPRFRPSQIITCARHTNEHALSYPPRKVLIENGKGTFCFFKTVHPGDRRSAQRELEIYKRMDEIRLENDVRVSRLHGVVIQDQDNGRERLIGLLLSYVDCRNKTLQCAAQPDTAEVLRKRWAKQVADTVTRLHQAKIIWGDAKAANVLIDANDDAWIIDFGGSYTEGWVTKEKKETVEGDLEGLARILDYLSTKTS